jgi:hypothetical protein
MPAVTDPIIPAATMLPTACMQSHFRKSGAVHARDVGSHSFTLSNLCSASPTHFLGQVLRLLDNRAATHSVAFRDWFIRGGRHVDLLGRPARTIRH